ncbi:DNA-binding transcriptional regulator, LysR family [Clostridium amylolyticum]|uniref:DNA-binding transcriptional regulator, LysR family n=1 Tax=Clostridium amylolyticum TaxID=1121298 RepID=A0A1M6BWA2_9CLOT|nr:LysR family transcriptional regulator [Clostridium amylolyticum]SHI52768.1 DNA-binding transcriptional regulator, LysR family [Clostridium amylolyticum]
MNIKLLEAFLAVVDNKTMSAAANKLFTTQPNISLMIKDLENYYSTTLFNRVSRRLYLTPEGQRLEKYARKVMADFKEMNEAMFNANKIIRIGSSVTVGQYLLNGYLNKLKSFMGNIKFEVVINNTAEIENLILNNRIDIAIVEGKINSKNITQVEILKDELIAVISYDYPLDNNIKYLSDLELLPWISREEGSHNRNQFEIDMNERKIYPQVVFRATNLETIIQAVENQYGFAIISKMAAEEALKKQSLKQLNFADYSCPRSIRYIYNKNHDKNPIISQILDCINN